MMSDLATKIAEEIISRDAWAAEITLLQLPKMIKQVALNAWKEQEGNLICLHLRPSLWHLNSLSAQKILTKIFAKLMGDVVKLIIIKDNNLTVRTPLEWSQVIYDEKIAQARKAIITDNNILILCLFFDADLDELSIFPI